MSQKSHRKETGTREGNGCTRDENDSEDSLKARWVDLDAKGKMKDEWEDGGGRNTRWFYGMRLAWRHGDTIIHLVERLIHLDRNSGAGGWEAGWISWIMEKMTGAWTDIPTVTLMAERMFVNLRVVAAKISRNGDRRRSAEDSKG